MESPIPPLPIGEQEIFDAAAALPAADRAAFLDAACEVRPGVRAGVEQLLASLEDDAFMHRAADRTTTPEVEAERAQLTPEAVGDQIGNYTLREQIGQGGFGTVWVAGQERPVRRRVALKIIKLGMDTKEVIARFEQERQALAMMDHPNIAKVLDAGATSSGRPYFVMELVRGIRITQYCDQSNLPTVDRLKLFSAVCHAVQHAHQKGIIHRDLKPSNILVTLHDGIPMPKVIDFGVAKATQQQRLTDLTIYTQFEQMIGTPLYMSPEQAEMSGLDIDTRSDIYSLGVLLYELLVGHTPFDPGTLMKAGFDEMRRVIREQEPQKPSTFVSIMSVEARTELAKHRQTDRAKLIGQIRGDLDWIVMKALEKDRSRRYETANGLAQDIQRHLQNEPIQARPPTALYRFRRMAKRNKVAFSAASAVVAALLIGLGSTTWMFFKEKYARERAVAAENEQGRLGLVAETEKSSAKTEAAISSQTAEFLRDMLRSMGAPDLLGESGRRLQSFLDKTAERLGKDQKEQPKVKGQMLTILGPLYFNLGEHSKAEAMIRGALAINRGLLGNENPDAARMLANLARTLQAQGKTTEAQAVLREGMAMDIKLFGNVKPHSAYTLEVLAEIVEAQGNSNEAETRLREALAMKQKTHGEEHPSVASPLSLLGKLLTKRNPVEAETLLRKVLKIKREHLGSNHLDVFATLNNLTYALNAQNELAESESAYREALEIGRNQLGDYRFIDSLLNNFGENLRNQGKLAESEVILREALAMSRRLYGPEHADTATPLCNLALVLSEQEKFEEAEMMFLEALAIRRRLFGAEHPAVLQSLGNLAVNLDAMGKWSEAEAMHREVLAIRRKAQGAEHPDVARSLSDVALALSKQGKQVEAEAMFREALELSRRVSGNENGVAAQSLHHLGILCHGQDRLPEAEAMIREGYELRKKLYGNEHWRVAESLQQLALLLEKKGNLPEAVTRLREAIAVQRKSTGAGNFAVAVYRLRMIEIMVSAGMLVEAESVLREELEAQRKLLGEDHPGAFTPLLELADILTKRDQPGEAQRLLGEAFAKWRAMAADTPGKLEEVTAPLADALWRQGNYAQAEPVAREMLDGRRKLYGQSDTKTVSAAAFLGIVLADRAWSERGSHAVLRKLGPETAKRALEAELLLRECLAARLQGPEAVHWGTDNVRSRLGSALIAVAVTDADISSQTRRGKLKEAENLLLETHGRLMSDRNVNPEVKRNSLTRVVRLYEALKKPEKLVEWQQKLDDFNKAGAGK